MWSSAHLPWRLLILNPQICHGDKIMSFHPLVEEKTPQTHQDLHGFMGKTSFPVDFQ
jgi:hypothetical protein